MVSFTRKSMLSVADEFPLQILTLSRLKPQVWEPIMATARLECSSVQPAAQDVHL